MIPGVVAAMTTRSGAGSSGTLAVADFINGIYTISGVSFGVAAMIDQPTHVEASGLRIRDDIINYAVFAIGEFLDILITCNWTMVIEYEVTSGWPGASDPADIINANTGEISLYDMPAFVEVYDAVRSATYAPTSDPVPRTRKVAWTITPHELAMSLDGNAASVHIAENDESLVVTEFVFGSQFNDGWASMTGYIRSITILTAVTDAELPALSTP